MPWHLCLYITLQYTKLIHTHLILSVALEDAPILQMRKSRLQSVGRLSQSRSCSKRQVGHWGNCLVCPLPEPLWWLIFIVNLTGSRITRKHTSRCRWASLQKCLPSRKDNSGWAAPSHWWMGSQAGYKAAAGWAPAFASLLPDWMLFTYVPISMASCWDGLSLELWAWTNPSFLEPLLAGVLLQRLEKEPKALPVAILWLPSITGLVFPLCEAN